MLGKQLKNQHLVKAKAYVQANLLKFWHRRLLHPKQTAMRNKQRERQQRGDDFQAEIRRSWRGVPNVWRMRIADGAGATRPGDEIVITPEVNILAEMKRTESRRFSLDYMRPNRSPLRDFDQIIDRNLGLVFISFLNDSKGLDEAYAFRLITALIHMKTKREPYKT